MFVLRSSSAVAASHAGVNCRGERSSLSCRRLSWGLVAYVHGTLMQQKKHQELQMIFILVQMLKLWVMQLVV